MNLNIKSQLLYAIHDDTLLFACLFASEPYNLTRVSYHHKHIINSEWFC